MPIDRPETENPNQPARRFKRWNCSCGRPPTTGDRAERWVILESDALAALGAEAEPRGWQPMDTAPIDETEVLLWTGSTRCVSRFIGGMWRIGHPQKNGAWLTALKPEGWMELPSPPVSGREAQENEQ